MHKFKLEIYDIIKKNIHKYCAQNRVFTQLYERYWPSVDKTGKNASRKIQRHCSLKTSNIPLRKIVENEKEILFQSQTHNVFKILKLKNWETTHPWRERLSVAGWTVVVTDMLFWCVKTAIKRIIALISISE